MSDKKISATEKLMNFETEKYSWISLRHPNVVVAALGYLVDMYDILLFTVVRRPSLEALGYSGDALIHDGIVLLNIQMLGMLCGGFFWGVLGDKRGRISVLFGSICLYSLANLANAWVENLEYYGFCRFFAGFGLAGELGIAVTLVSEVIPRSMRGFATGLIAAFGGLGIILSAIISEVLNWRMAYLMGGILGLSLLILRFKTMDSDLFKKLRADRINRRGDLRMLFRNGRIRRYFLFIFMGIPLWFQVGMVTAFSPEIAKSIGIQEPIKVSIAVMVNNIGAVLGDVLSSFSSYILASRRKVIQLGIVISGVCTFLIFSGMMKSQMAFYVLLTIIGVSIGYWAVLVTTIAEHFGTNLRATVTTTLPNLIRASMIPMSTIFEFLRPKLGLQGTLGIVGIFVYGCAVLASLKLSETFGKDLDFLEID